MDECAARESVATTARMMSAAGLSQAFGHVSARCGNGFAITSTLPFAEAGPDDVIIVADAADVASGGGSVPLETPMHAALYMARPDVGAVCRGHPPAVVTWGVGTEELPLLHGLGALAGERVRVHPDVDLISTLTQGAAVAEALGDGQAVVLRSNGCLAVGATPLEALTRLYFLEERARVALGQTIDRGDISWRARFRHTEAELQRAMAWIQATFAHAGPSETTRRH